MNVLPGTTPVVIVMNPAKGGMIKMLSVQMAFEQEQALALAAANSLLEKPAPSFIG